MVFIFFSVAIVGSAYTDPELEALWGSLSSLDAPTLEDYRLVEAYLSNGKRLYLQPLYENCVAPKHFNLFRQFKLVGPNGEMPTLQIHKGADPKKCILIFGSYNGCYPKKAEMLFKEIIELGFDGDILLRIGGFPNGDLKLCYVPYAFKVAFLKEAALLGYEKILWLDTAIHPLVELDWIFEEMEGVFLTTVGMLHENHHRKETSEFLKVPPELHSQIPHMSAAIIGLNLASEEARCFLDEWLFETTRLFPNLSWFPEELCLSIVAWRNGIFPCENFGNLVCNEPEVLELFYFEQKPGLQFYLDLTR